MIDTSTFVYKENRWQDIFSYLVEEGYDVYPPGKHKGACNAEYIVVKSGSSSRMLNFSTDEALYDIMMYIPEEKFSTVESFAEGVKASLRGLFPLVKQYGIQTEPFFDEAVQGHMVSVMYSNYKKL